MKMLQSRQKLLAVFVGAAVFGLSGCARPAGGISWWHIPATRYAGPEGSEIVVIAQGQPGENEFQTKVQIFGSVEGKIAGAQHLIQFAKLRAQELCGARKPALIGDVQLEPFVHMESWKCEKS